jgi:hypothetical protein
MGRAPCTLLFALLVSALQPATAFGVDGDGETTFALPLQANHGLSVKLEADDDEIELLVQKKGQQAVYSAPGEVSPEGIAVKFGSFGEFVVGYRPFRTLETHGPNRHCEGEPRTTTEGFFRGTMRFLGEDGYVQVEAARAKGTLVLQPEWECDYGRAKASRAARGHKARDDRATLVAYTRPESIKFAAIGSRQEDEPPYTLFIAAGQEVRDGVTISRLTFSGPRSAGFEFDNCRGTAFVDPPAPYAGSAHYRRRPEGPDKWRGSLTVPLLGLGRVRLAGPQFKAVMVARLPNFE